MTRETILVQPDRFEPSEHYYPRVLNAQLHPLVRFFLGLGNARIAERFAHLHPEVDPDAVAAALAHRPRHFLWGGADLFHTTNAAGVRHIVVIETNSCPSGQKSTPLFVEHQEQGGYRTLIEGAFVPLLRRRGLPAGGLAVLHDKNLMEVSGYAAVIADVTGEPVFLVPCFDDEAEPATRFTEDGVLEIRDADRVWHPIRAALRYVTQRPWNRIPVLPRTAMLNPVLVCLAGGRNKMLAAKAYDLYNADLEPSGLQVRTPETIWDVARDEVPLWVHRMGGVAVVKAPYSNAGQGVYTIVNADELAAFMESEQRYDRFIVQALIGNAGWSSRGRFGRLFHVGTVPDKRGQIHVADLRCMVGSSPDGFFPVAIYARRTRRPLEKRLEPGATSWEMLGTNLSVRQDDGSWTTEPERLLLMDNRDFNHLGLGLDDLVEAYLQTVLAVTAIDNMAQALITQKGRFRRRFFESINPDPTLVGEIISP